VEKKEEKAKFEVHRQKKSENQDNETGPIGPVCESPCLNYRVGTFGRFGGQLVAKKHEKKKKKNKEQLVQLNVKLKVK
jgi:hypothetical protein